MLKKIFSEDNIANFVIVAIACGVALVFTPKVLSWFTPKTTTTTTP